MPFSEEFVYHKKNVRGNVPRAVAVNALGVLRFNVSSDHATNVTHYEVRIEPQGTNTIVARRLLGKPWPTSGATVYFDIENVLSALPPGNYNAVVVAVNKDGEAVSSDSNTFIVPLIPE